MDEKENKNKDYSNKKNQSGKKLIIVKNLPGGS